MVTTVLDVIAVACLALFAYFVWPPLPLAVVGVVALAISYRRSSRTVGRS